MSEKQKSGRQSIVFIWTFIIMLVSGVATVLFTIVLIFTLSKNYINAADARLLIAAEMLSEIVGPDYHNKIIDSTTISQEKYSYIVERNDDLCRRLHLQYLWSVLVVDDHFVFTTATHSDIENPTSPVAAFFERHQDPESFKLAMESEMKPVFSTFDNEWGKGRQVLVPRTDENGRTYIFGASIQMTDYNTLILQAVMVSLPIGVLIMGGAFLLASIFARRFTNPITRLIETANKMADGDLDATLPISNVNELQSLAHSLDQLRSNLKQRIKELFKSNALLDTTQRLTKVGGWEWNIIEQTMFWTVECFRIHGLSPEKNPAISAELIQVSLDCYDPPDRLVISAAFQECIEKGLPCVFEVPFTNMLGERFWVRTGAEAVSENGKIVRVVGNIMDISEQKRSEKAIRESEEKYRLIINNTHDVIYILTADGIFTFVSPAWTILLGHQVSQVTGKSFQQFVHPDDIPACMNWLQKVIETGARQEGIEYRVQHVDGLFYWHTSSAVPILDTAGKVIGFNGIARDITDRKLAEEAQLTSEEQFRLIFEKASVGYTMINLDGSYARVNQAFATMLGYSIEDMIDKNWVEFTHPEDIKENKENLSALLTGEKDSIVFEKRYCRKDGTSIYALNSPTLLSDVQNKPLFYITNVLDITERKQMEEELLESKERYKSLHNASFGGIAIHDQGIIIECNQGLSTMMGYSLDELRSGMDGLLLIAPSSRDLVRKNIISGYEQPYEAFGIRKNGEIFPMRLEARNIPYKGKTVRTVEFRDITAQKLAEEKIKEDQIELQRLLAETEHSRQALLSVVEDQKETEEQIQKLNDELEERVLDRTAQLESANKELEAFSYSVSHDLRAPLRGIDGWSLALEEDYHDQLDEKGRGYIDRIRGEAEKMGHLIEDLLRLSRITRMDINKSKIDLSDYARNITDRFNEENQNRVNVVIQSGLTVNGDPNLLAIVLENLFSNAFKFSSKIENPIIEIGSTIIEGQSTYFIRDNGAGFEMEYAKNLFGAFQRMHKQTDFPGTGVGLAIVQRIINRHGGKIWAEAKVNEGATFYFTLLEDR